MRVVAAFVITSLLVGRAWAQPAEPEPPTSSSQLTVGPPVEIEIPGQRSATNILALSVAAGLGVVGLGVGAGFHLGSRSVSNELAADDPTGRVWTAQDQRDYDRGQRDITRAEVFYSIGGVLLVGAAVAFIVTAPRSRKEVLHPHLRTMVTPTSGGAFIAHAWSW